MVGIEPTLPEGAGLQSAHDPYVTTQPLIWYTAPDLNREPGTLKAPTSANWISGALLFNNVASIKLRDYFGGILLGPQ